MRGGQTTKDAQDTDGVGSIYVPLKTVQLHEHAQTQQGKNHHKTPTTDKREMTKGWKLCDFLQGLSSDHQRPRLWHRNVIVVDRLKTSTAPLSVFLMTERGTLHERGLGFPVIIDILSGDVVMCARREYSMVGNVH